MGRAQPITKLFILLTLAAVCGCHRTETNADAPRPRAATETETRLNNEDALVIAAVLEDFAECEDVAVPYPDRKNRLIVVDLYTHMPTVMLTDQIGAEMRGTAWSVPQPIQEDMRRRNMGRASLKNIPLGDHVVTQDLARFRNGPGPIVDLWDRLKDERPDAKAYVQLWLPGYSHDGTTAFMRFSFGWTAHGAMANYLLVKKGGKWKVKQRFFVYYG